MTTSAPLPLPPDDLADFPVLVVRANQPLVRIHRELWDPAWFNANGTQRFDPPSGGPATFGTCYLSTHPRGAFVEVFGRTRPVQRRHVDERVVSTVNLPSDVRLADLTNPVLIGRFGLTAELSISRDYGVPQRWARALFEAGFSGVHYAARHDPSLETRSVALFGKPGAQPEQLLVVDTSPIPEALLRDVESRFGLVVLPDAPLA